MNKYPETAQSRERRAAEKLRRQFAEPERWERSPHVDVPLLAISNFSRQQIVTELSNGPLSTQELLAAIPELTPQKMSAHLKYLFDSEWVTWHRLPKVATKVWTLNEGILCDVIDTIARLNAPAYERMQARRAAKRLAV